MDLERERRIIRLFEEAVDWPDAVRRDRLGALLASEPDILAAVLALLDADATNHRLPTVPPAVIPMEEEASPPEVIGNYRIIEEIGRGGMGLVYRAARNDGLFDQQVAIKVIRRNILSATTHEQFDVERRILARLHHPHISNLLDGGIDTNGSSYIIMELIEGLPITDYAQAKNLALSERLALFRDACGALEYAHRNLVVHADVKPSNVVVSEAFGVKLLDFGIARLIGEDAGRVASAHTPGYSSPARLSGERSTPTDDVFALGVLMEDMIRGVHAADDDLHAVAAKAACKDASERYGSVSALIADLDRWQRHEPVTARPPGRLRWLLLLLRRNRLAFLAAALLASTATVTSYLYVQADHDRATAERRFGDVRSMANYMMFDLDPQMARLSGALPARRSAAEKASQYLETLGGDAEGNPELALEIVRSHLRLANIYGYDASGGLDDFPKANRQLAKAEAILRRFPTNYAQPGQLALAQGEFELTRAAAALVEQTEASLPAARRSIENASARFDTILRSDPANIDADYGKWRASIYLIRLDLYAGRTKAAITTGMTERARGHHSPTTPGQQVEFDFLTSAGLTGLAQAQYEDHDYVGTLKSFQEAKAALEAVLAAGRGGFETRNFLSIAETGIADCQEKLGRLDEAIRSSERGLKILIDLRRSGPNDSLDDDIGVTQIHLAGQYAKAGRSRDAKTMIDAFVAAMQLKAQKNPSVAAAQRGLAIALQAKASIQLRLQESLQACKTISAAQAQWQITEKLGGVVAMDRTDDTGLRALKKMLTKCGLGVAH